MTVYARSQLFCCCLPVRFGVLIMSFLGLAGGVLVTAGSIIKAEDSVQTQTALIIAAIAYGLLSVFSLFGFIGAIIENRRCIIAFFIMHVLATIITMAAGIFALVLVFEHTDGEVSNCQLNAPNQSFANECPASINMAKWILLSFFVVSWLITVYGAIIIGRYKDQLNEEEDYQHSLKGVKA